MRKSYSLIFVFIIIFLFGFSQLLFSLSEWIEYNSQLHYVPLLDKIDEEDLPEHYEILEYDETLEVIVVVIDGVLYVAELE